MNYIRNHRAVWNATEGEPLSPASAPAGKRPHAFLRDQRNQFEFDYLIYRLSQYFQRYNQAVYDSKGHPNDPTYADKVSSIVQEYRAFVKVPYVPNGLDEERKGSVITVSELVVTPTFDSDGLITGFLTEGSWQVKPGTPDDYSSSSSSRKM